LEFGIWNFFIMCGIFGIIGERQNAAKIVLDGLKTLEYRGYDSWGVAVVPEGKDKIVVKKKIGKIGSANVDDLPSSSFAFGHTRWATHGGVTERNSHPHLDCTKKIAVIQNGIVENYEEIKNSLLKKNHKFISETDTEVISHLIEEYAKKNSFQESVRLAFNDLEGLNAIIAIYAAERKFVVARNGSPLILGFGKNENFVASDVSALIPYTKQVFFLDDNQMAVLEADKIQVYDVKNGAQIKITPQEINWTLKESEKGNYPDFMSKEMSEQPKVIARIAEGSVVDAERLSGIIKESRGSYFLGCGSASYVGLAGSYLFSKIARRHINFAIGSEFGYHLDFLNSQSLVIAISQSGETMDIIESVKKAKMRGTKIFALVNVLGSTLYRMSDYKMLIGAGPEKAVASTKAVTAQLSHLTLLAYAMAGKSREGQKVLFQASKSVESVLKEKNVAIIKKLANILKKSEHVYVIGRGLSYPASLECAIKIKEISYIHAEGMAAGELKHGPLALVEKGTPCIAFLPDDETYGANLAGAMEMKARGGFVVGISHKPHEIFDYFLKVDDAKEATIIPNIVTSQLLAYHLTIALGLDPDKPRNLAKSVTVK